MAYFRDMKEKHWLSLIVSLLLGNAAYYMTNLKHPYRGVELLEAYIQDDYLYTTHTFEKLGCERKRFTVTAVDGVTSQFLEFEGLDGVEEGHDRDEGLQTLRLRAFLGKLRPDEVIYRTRHLCDGTKVDKIFDTINTENL